MSSNRKKCFDSIVNNSHVTVQLVTEKNLEQFNVPTDPIHSAFQYLSSTHKSDYLRSYFMYHYGGGYSDIKKCNYDWNRYFDMLQYSDKQFIGYAEISQMDIANQSVKHLYKKLIGNCSYIFKTKTPFAKLWLDETNKKLDSIAKQLQENPGTYHHRAIKGGIYQESGFRDSKYPLEWNELLGRIFHKLQSEHLDTFLMGMPRVNTSNYR
jgi:hypothetical protein